MQLFATTYKYGRCEYSRSQGGEQHCYRCLLCVQVCSGVGQLATKNLIISLTETEGVLAPRSDLPTNLLDFLTYLRLIFPNMPSSSCSLPIQIWQSQLKFDKFANLAIQHKMYEMLTCDSLVNFTDSIAENTIFGYKC